ncbi:unnamed protein product [Prorocentrum cordatum]|uniref:Uncharacterized protein n=1 Tax=Prorocentrum cordatum TaxID=2364126 RepID=A0ABN9YFL0_9DINO|nr:unnamed protein product [Polarella glacialis]
MDEPFEQRVVFPPKANCNEESWTIPKFKVSGEKHVTFSQKPWIVFRGATFRSSEDAQEVALCSIRRHVVEPPKRACALNSVHVHLCVRPHGANRRLVASAEKYFGAAIGFVNLLELSRAEQPLQQGQYRACLADVPNDARFALILRPDLVLKESLSFDRAVSPDMFYFQWNLFQSCVNREIADQIHLAGGNLIPELKDKWNSEQMGAVKAGQPFWDSFHMMIMWAANALGQERLGYLMEYPATNCFYLGSGEHPRWHKYGFCKQRGNPGGGITATSRTRCSPTTAGSVPTARRCANGTRLRGPGARAKRSRRSWGGRLASSQRREAPFGCGLFFLAFCIRHCTLPRSSWRRSEARVVLSSISLRTIAILRTRAGASGVDPLVRQGARRPFRVFFPSMARDLSAKSSDAGRRAIF